MLILWHSLEHFVPAMKHYSMLKFIEKTQFYIICFQINSCNNDYIFFIFTDVTTTRICYRGEPSPMLVSCLHNYVIQFTRWRHAKIWHIAMPPCDFWVYTTFLFGSDASLVVVGVDDTFGARCFGIFINFMYNLWVKMNVHF